MDTLANMNGLWGDSTGNLFYAQIQNYQSIKIVTHDTKIAYRIAGTGTVDGTNVDSLSVLVTGPCAVTGDQYGNLYFTDIDTNTVRKLTPSEASFDIYSVSITTVIANRTIENSSSVVVKPQMGAPTAIWHNGEDKLYFYDSTHRCVRA